MEKEKHRRHVFFVPLLFIGMGVGFILIPFLGGEAFTASMFIGMGIGFLLDSIFTIEEKTVTIRRPVTTAAVSLMIIGAIFIVGGALFIINPKFLRIISDILIGLGFVTAGIFIFLSGYSIFKKH